MAIKTVKIKNIGACLLRINKTNVSPSESVDVDESEIKSQAFKHLFISGVVEFEDEPKKTRELVAEFNSSIKTKKKKEPKSIEELETGADIK